MCGQKLFQVFAPTAPAYSQIRFRVRHQNLCRVPAIKALKLIDWHIVLLPGVHPEIYYRHEIVSNSEMRNFSQDQGNQGIARRRMRIRRTSKPAD